jgi:HEXXH motif-containing protein
VRTIQVLRTDDADIDLSYSHPNIPFSIFISVCDNESMISNLRVAESILHEAMHLKLTLIEDLIPLIKPDTNSLYYSPWRNEERPAKGVLHGLFVFRAIREFYKELQKIGIFIDSENYLENRLREIENEVEQLKDFATSPSLNELGTNLVISLLPLN